MHFQGGSSLHWPPFFTLCIYTLITQGNPDPPQTSVERSVRSRRNNYDAGNNNVSWHYSPNPPVLERARMERCSTRPGLVCKRGAEKCIKQSFNSHFKCVSSYYIAHWKGIPLWPFPQACVLGRRVRRKAFLFFFSLWASSVFLPSPDPSGLFSHLLLQIPFFSSWRSESSSSTSSLLKGHRLWTSQGGTRGKRRHSGLPSEAASAKWEALQQFPERRFCGQLLYVINNSVCTTLITAAVMTAAKDDCPNNPFS